MHNSNKKEKISKKSSVHSSQESRSSAFAQKADKPHRKQKQVNINTNVGRISVGRSNQKPRATNNNRDIVDIHIDEKHESDESDLPQQRIMENYKS